MKKDLHPTDYRPVVFQDTSDGSTFLTRSTAQTSETIKWEDGNEYPLIKIHISSTSHPFYTGKEKVLDLEGRVDRFKDRAKKAKAAQEARLSKAKKNSKKSDDDASSNSDTVKIGDKNAPTPELKAS